MVSIFGMHRDENLIKDAGLFQPERFLSEKSAETQNAFTYIPFSAGKYILWNS